MIPKFKKANLYLYNHFYNYTGNSEEDTDLPVLALSIAKNYSAWLCLLPSGNTKPLFPEDLIDITNKNK